MWDSLSSFAVDAKLKGLADSRMISAMRLLLASSSLVIIYLDPAEPDRFVAATYITLVLYALYSAVLFYITHRAALQTVAKLQGSWLKEVFNHTHWIDLGWYTVLIALSSGTNSLFFFGFFFSILVASFRWGFASGLKTVVVSTILFTVVGYATAPSDVDLNRLLLRTTSMLLLGYMIAYLGGFAVLLMRRLALLKEVNTLSNPRFGVDRTVGLMVERLRAFYDADACLLIAAIEGGDYRLHRANRRQPEAAMRAEPIATVCAHLLLGFPDGNAVVYSREWRNWWGMRPTSFFAFDIKRGVRVTEGQEICERLVTTLDTRSFVTVPMRYRNKLVGRLYLAAKRAFLISDMEFILQVVKQAAPVIDDVSVVDRLASDAADEERRRIARTIHDSVIQSCIGLQMALMAIRQKIANGDSDVTADIDRSVRLTNAAIADMRRYVLDLSEPGEQGGNLLPAVRRFAATYTEATGTKVKVESNTDIQISDRLAAEAFEMVIEGLSNITRHSQAGRATLTFARDNGDLLIGIENDSANGDAPRPFTPRSIAERAAALGGQTRVDVRDGRTLVEIAIPL